IEKRQSGYRPEIYSCGTGKNCAEACGSSYQTCNSSAAIALFCYNPQAGQICCPNGSGKACDSGYYCAQQSDGQTWCCKEVLDLVACAARYGLSDLMSATTMESALTTVVVTHLVVETSVLEKTITEPPALSATT
ncbi:hypothetical protein P154DRAFT_384552, partial [Amniculicola lignicola CBS 123094]